MVKRRHVCNASRLPEYRKFVLRDGDGVVREASTRTFCCQCDAGRPCAVAVRRPVALSSVRVVTADWSCELCVGFRFPFAFAISCRYRTVMRKVTLKS